MQTSGMLYRLPCISLGEERGCYIVVIKLSPGEENPIIHNLVITFQSHAVQEINNVRVSLGIKKQMAPPPGLLPLTFESLSSCILWGVSYDFGTCWQWMSPLWHTVISIYVFNQRNTAVSDWTSGITCEVREEPCCYSYEGRIKQSFCVVTFAHIERQTPVNIKMIHFFNPHRDTWTLFHPSFITDLFTSVVRTRKQVSLPRVQRISTSASRLKEQCEGFRGSMFHFRCVSVTLKSS